MISTKGRYALRVMIDMAERQDAGYIPLKDVADRQDISKKYLEIIVKELVHAGFLTGVSGKGGGYKLCRSPEDYTVGEILTAVEGTLSPVACLADGAAPCPRQSVCKTLPMWREYYGLVSDFFHSKLLSELL